MVKHAFMIQLWRFQQSQAILGLVLWAVLLTLASVPVVSPVILRVLNERLSIPPNAPGAVLAVLLLMFVSITAVLFAFGFVYDRYLKLWREQTDVAVDRNPYAREKLTAKEILMWKHMFLPALRGNPSNPGVEEDIAFMQSWIERSMKDPRTRKAVEETRGWIESKM